MSDLRGVDALIEQVEDSPLALAGLARTLLLSKGHDERARELCDRAVAMAPSDPEIQAIRAEVYSQDIEQFYFSMVRDSARHGAYVRAFARAFRSGGRALDIGAGTGLFAMLAARAGASEVIACERSQQVAAAAAMVVDRNGYQDRVRIVPKASTDLVMGVDLDAPVDVLIWDNLANNMMGAGALASVEDALRRLVKPGGAVIPARVALKAALAEDRGLHRRRMGIVDGFDLSPFNRFATPQYHLRCDAAELSLRSEAVSLFDFDFETRGPHAAAKVFRSVIGEGGAANGVVQWLAFELDDRERYEARPGTKIDAFGLRFHPTAEPFEALRGGKFMIGASHDRMRVRIWRA